MKNHIDALAFEANALLQISGKPDLLNQIVELFKFESPESIAALSQGVDSSDFRASIAELTLPVRLPD